METIIKTTMKNVETEVPRNLKMIKLYKKKYLLELNN